MTMLATLNARRPQQSRTWEITSDYPMSPALLSPGALEHGFDHERHRHGSSMRMRSSALKITPFPFTMDLNIRRASAHPGTPLKSPGTPATPKRRSIPSKAFAALNNSMYRRKARSRKSQQKDKIIDSPPPFSKDPEHGNGDISLELLNKKSSSGPIESPEIREEPISSDSTQPRRLPPIPIPPEKRDRIVGILQ
ncbi:hypothetical protein PM082_015017 [Marasmius tenuissimus]|nr:hypothetical protein PM082_015017 [Marasmius tenuissimus]